MIVTLTNRIYTVLDTDEDMSGPQLIIESASLFLENRFLSYIELFMKTARRRIIGIRIRV